MRVGSAGEELGGRTGGSTPPPCFVLAVRNSEGVDDSNQGLHADPVDLPYGASKLDKCESG